MVSRKASQTAKGFQHQSQHTHRFRLSCFSVLVPFILTFIIFSCTHTSRSNFPSLTNSANPSGAIRIWCDKGFTVEEDEALQQVVSTWEKQTGNKIKLSFYTNDELPQKTERAIKAGNPPDMMMGYSAEKELNPRLAWEGKLADVSDVIESVKSFYPEAVLEAIYFYNNVDKKRSYYAVPIHQGTIHIFYWRDLLKLAGRKESDIPKDWDGFWEFWKQVQDELRSRQKQNLYALGFPYSVGAADTYYTFEHIL